MTIKQLSVFLENKPGKLMEITESLANGGVDIRAITIADTADYGILRLIVDKPQKAVSILSSQGMTISETDVIAFAVTDQVGGLGSAVKILSDAGISIEYVYAYMTHSKEFAVIILRVSDQECAIKVLQNANIQILRQNEIGTL